MKKEVKIGYVTFTPNSVNIHRLMNITLIDVKR
jgi:hypothetical protein